MTTPLHCPRCRRPVAFYVDQLGRVHAYCAEQERKEQMGLGTCERVKLPKVDRRRGRKPIKKSTRGWSAARRDALRRFWQRKAVAA